MPEKKKFNASRQGAVLINASNRTTGLGQVADGWIAEPAIYLMI
jgi:hypothetical protein